MQSASQRCRVPLDEQLSGCPGADKSECLGQLKEMTGYMFYQSVVIPLLVT